VTAEPLPPPAADGEFPHLTDEEILLLDDDEYQLYLRLLEAEVAEAEQREPVPNSPGEIASLITGGTELHPRHLQLVDEAYLALERYDIDRLLITMPPQHGKSSRARWGSLHRLTRRPEDRIVVASAELDLAREHTRWVRNTIEANPQLGLGTARDRRSARAWDLEGHRGGMYAVGVGGALTGRPADLLVLDDPVKDPKQVEKPEQRAALWRWWTTVAMTRLAPKAGAVVIMTRWHEDDIAGRILNGPDANDWKVLHLPAIADGGPDLLEREKGEPLWPARYDLDWLRRKQVELGSRDFAALYQGQPVPAGGTLLKKHWFKTEHDWPRYGAMLRFWDFAATDGDDGGDPDWTVGALVALWGGRWWIVDIERFRESPHGVKQRVAQVRDRDGRSIPIRAEQEPGSSGKTVIHDLATTVFAGYDFRARPATGSKVLRAKPLAAAAEAGNVTVLQQEWTKAFLDEVESFPFGAHDDQVDAVSGAMAWLASPLEEAQHVQQGRWSHVPSRR
jgi:predicted phage terminase large subunit-like protein